MVREEKLEMNSFGTLQVLFGAYRSKGEAIIKSDFHCQPCKGTKEHMDGSFWESVAA